MMGESDRLINRWRLVLGKYAESGLGEFEPDGSMLRYREISDLMEFLYGREYNDEMVFNGMHGGLEDSMLTVPDWLHRVHALFPKKVVEKLEAYALDRYGLTELLTDARVLEKLEPNMTLLKQILSLKHMMRGDVLRLAHDIVRQATEALARKMRPRIRAAIMGRRDRSRSSPFRCAKNFDFKKTINKNLKNYDHDAERLAIERVYFHRNVERHNPWHIIICVDESGSMMENVIHSAVMAGIFAKLPALSVKLVIFDTNVVDLTGYVDDPVETLMSVQLGGGTDIGKALAYCEGLFSAPQRTILILVSDLCDGAGYREMYRTARRIIETGAKLICLTALDKDCEGMYDRTAAKHMSMLGASVAALTPEGLADWIGQVISGGK
jgi:Mg-chelatase subunit ChlD